MATEKLKVTFGAHKSFTTLVLPKGYGLTETSVSAVSALTRQYPRLFVSATFAKGATTTIYFLGATALIEDVLPQVKKVVAVEAKKWGKKPTEPTKAAPAKKAPTAKAKKATKVAPAVEVGDEEWTID